MPIPSPSTPRQKAPEISVIVPVYNVANYVIACLDSIRNQTMTDFEVIVVDDGSTDGSGDLALEYCQSDARFHFVTQPNRGLSGARNTGLDLAQAEVISFVDSDDRLAPEFLAELYDALQETGCDWVACAVKSCYPDGNYSVHSAIHGAAEFHETPVWRRYRFDNWQQVIPHFPSAWNKLYRRSLIEGLRFDEGTWFEDHSFFQRAAAQTDHLLHLPRPLYLQTRGREGQITSSDSDRVFEQLDVLQRLRGIMDLGPFEGAREAYEKIASRLLFERSLSLRTPSRRVRFAQESARFLQREGLTYASEWDSDIALSWAIEMGGSLPLTVCVECPAGVEPALQTTLDSLGTLMGPGFEVFLLCRSKSTVRAVQAQYPKLRVFDLNDDTRGALWQAARGRFVSILRPGVTLEPAALLQMVEQMLRHEAQVGLSAYMQPDANLTEHQVYCTGFADRRPFGTSALEKGPISIDGAAALTLLPELSARMFDRQFLLEQGLGFTKSPRASWAMQLAAASLAPSVVYDPWASITLPSHPLATADAGPVGKGHDALVQAVPKPVQDSLPKGWQRRLFDRAAQAEQRSKDNQNRARTHLNDLALMRSATRRGLQGVTPQEASFDPPLSEARAKVFDPVGHVAAVLRRPRSYPLPLRQADLDMRVIERHYRDEYSSNLYFPAEAHSSFSAIVDIDKSDYANLNFLQADGLTVPLHLSFRGKERCVVLNHCSHNGWGHERSWPLPYEGSLITLRVVVAGHTVRLFVDGVSLFEVEVDARFHTPGQRALGFTYVELQGNFRPVDLVPVPPSSSLSLDPRLMVQAAQAPETHHIREVTSGSLLPVTALEGRSLRSLLPARLWKAVLAQGNSGLHLQLEHVSGQSVGAPLLISRQDMARYLDNLLRHKPGCVDTTLVLTALEHIVYAKIYPMLSSSAQSSAHRYAAHFGLQTFLSGASDNSDSEPSTLAGSVRPKVNPIAQEIDAALASVGGSVASDGGQSALDVVAQMPVSAYAAQDVYLVLGEVFARQDQDFTAFYALAQAAGVQPYASNGHAWHDTAVLPFLFLQGDIDALLHTLRSLVKPREDWMVTSTVAWVVRHALHSEALTPRQRAHVVFLFDMFISKRTPNYWERAHCRELTLTAVELALHHEALGARQGQQVLRFCVRNYGLSRLFWEALVRRGVDRVPEGLQLAFTYYNEVFDHAADPEAAYQGLLYFDGAKNRDAPRVRRELFGPAGVPLPTHIAPTVATLRDTHWDPEAAALRFMATPGTAQGDAALSDMVSSHIPKVSQHQVRSRFLAEQHQVATDIAQLLSAADGFVEPHGLDDLVVQCCDLGYRRSNFLGVALCLILITHFRSSDNTALSARIAGHLQDHLQTLSDSDVQALKSSTPVLMALVSLQRDPQTQLLVQHVTELPFDAAREIQSPVKSELSGSPLYDTIVTLFSCKPYLDSRIPPLRAGWLRLLEGLGVPYVVVVGDGDGQRRGDVLHLDAPDNYEGLPQKTLAAIEWVHSQTNFAHMVKLDDDCFLNAPLFFQSLTYRKFDYFGRKLTREVGQLDRVWHQQKSTSPRGRMELDKSPEPSTYADGGSGYALSRRAMQAALSAAQSAEGQDLIQLSFMEDKLLGDLLALRGISVADEDYTVTVRRRPHREAIPVASWQNGFDSSLTAPVHLVHMDTSEGHQEAVTRLGKRVLTPKKIWPSFQKARLGYQSNALELISPASRLQQAREAEVALVACMRNEMFMLPHFLDHYRKLGVGAFLIADNTSDDGTLEFLAEQPDVSVFSVDTDYNVSRYGVAWQQALLAEYRVNKWSLVADADELLVWQEKQTQTLPDLLSEPEFVGAEAVRLFMLDMYPKGPLEDARFQHNPFEEAGYCDRRPFLTNIPAFGPFSDQPTWTSALRHRLIPGSRPNLFVAQKLALLRYQPWMRLSAGLHYVGDARLAPRDLIFAHFKYNSDFRRKAETEVARRQHFNNAEEYQKYLALASEGRSVIYDRDISLPWTQTGFVKSIFSQSQG